MHKIAVTETLLIDELGHARQILSTSRNQGSLLSLDDFGTGYRSLTHLQKFPVDDIKIDKSFVRSVLSDHGSRYIVKPSIVLAEAMDLEVVAEGVESREEIRELVDMHCCYCQGYYFAKPLPPAEAIEYLRQNC
ncbi:MAG: EAL domain-containing protein [Gammaproteobacteria bacterium]|nr:EAL domain-containing protein [Gammaproteobacteria bacterium]MCI0590369.1 EAL domain-containing protein [Gammaproteobacteria bacterium]